MNSDTTKRAPDPAQIARLHALDHQAVQIRQKLGISTPGEVVFQGDIYVADDDKAVVEANGYGGALLSVVEGNYPIDYITKHSREFERECDATKVANGLVEQWVQPEHLSDEKITLESLLKRADENTPTLKCRQCSHETIEEDFVAKGPSRGRKTTSVYVCPECGSNKIAPAEDT